MSEIEEKTCIVVKGDFDQTICSSATVCILCEFCVAYLFCDQPLPSARRKEHNQTEFTRHMLCIGKASVSAHAKGVAGLFKFK